MLSDEEKERIMAAYGLEKGSIQLRERDGKFYPYWVYHDQGRHERSLGRLEDVLEAVERVEPVEAEEPLEPSEPVANGKLGWLLGLLAAAVLWVLLYRFMNPSRKGQ